jgi:hypothetical protein
MVAPHPKAAETYSAGARVACLFNHYVSNWRRVASVSFVVGGERMAAEDKRGGDRRGEDRRVADDPDYKGPERRKGDRRSGKERRESDRS